MPCGNCRQPGHNRRTCPDVIRLRIGVTPEQAVALAGLENTSRTRDALWRQIQNRINRRRGLTAADEPLRSRLDREIASLGDIQNYLATDMERPINYSVRPVAARSRETVSLTARGAASPSSILLPAVREINPPAHIPVSAPAPEPSTSTPAPESEEPPKEVKVIESESCPVCMEDFDGKTKIDKATLKCGHQICSGCLATWMRENHTCPSCREPIAERIPKKFTLTRGVREHIVADMSNTGRRNGNFQRILDLLANTPGPSQTGGVDQRLRYIEYEMENMVIAGLRQAERILNIERD